MSGSEGPDYTVMRGSAGSAECAGLRKEKPLLAPNADVIADLVVGDVLGVDLRDSSNPAIAIVADDGREAGAVMPDEQLIECLRQGYIYRARVTTIRGGHVSVIVEPS